MAQAYTEARPSELAHPVRDGGLLLDQPGAFVLLPDVLGPAHHEQHVEGFEVGNGLPRIELHGEQSEAGSFKEGTEHAGVFVRMVLKDEDRPSTVGRWLRAKLRARRRGHGRMSRYSLTSQSVTVPMNRSHSSRL